MSDVRAAVTGYAARMHRAIGSEHHIASPLGAWLVLAFAASAARDDLRSQLASRLGMPVGEASAQARALLEKPPAILHLAAAVWTAQHAADIDAWLTSLPNEVDVGPIPSQAEANVWADKHTLGLIKQFPADLSKAILVLTSALACEVSWRRPFDTAVADELELTPATGFDSVGTLLSSSGRDRISVLVATDHGVVAAHVAAATHTEMLVVSVIADPEVPSSAVLEDAHTIAVSLARSAPVPGQLSLFDVRLGPSHSWTVTEHVERGDRDWERMRSILPAWSAESKHDLVRLGDLGFDVAGRALYRLIGGAGTSAAQAAVAQYTREGFKAAAITSVMQAAAARRYPNEVRVREALIEYTHPHAVVAVSVDDKASPWAGMPLFSAWVTHADEAE
ncbi:MAG TPA: serpin family protein [Jatrophihabitantaceae bacterium]|nr:serpin family protein [Jatrophihabitantaceae bacterium]